MGTIRKKGNLPIGVFDSGLGGLTVVRSIRKILKNESIIYLGDTARLPYGSKSQKSIIKFSNQNVSFLLQKKVKAIVVACNSSSSVAIEELKKRFNIPIFGVIEPGSYEAIKATKNSKIGVIGTTATIKSSAYQKELKKRKKNIKIFTKACPLFVPLIEEGWSEHKITYEVAEIYLSELRRKKIDTLIMGCTHYPMIKKVINHTMNGEIKLIDSGEAVAFWLKNYLKNSKTLAKNQNTFYHYYLTDYPQKFKRIAEEFLGEPLTYVKNVNIGG